MDICIIYHSKYGNGKILVEHLGTLLKDKGHGTKILPILEHQSQPLPWADLYVFSSPTHIGGPPGKMKRFLKKLTVEHNEGKFVVITTTMDGKGKTRQKMEEMLSGKGMVKHSEGLAIIVKGIKGPLEEEYKEKLEKFVSEILESI